MDRVKFLQELKKFWEQNDIPNISLENAKFLRGILRMRRPKRMLEIGTANGFSAINFWDELEKFWGKLITIEFSPNSQWIAKENIAQAELEKTIDSLLWNALDIIPRLEGEFECVFIDGMKRRTKDFFELIWDKVPESGVVIVDDVIKFREKMMGFWEMLEERQIEYTILPIDEDDGILFIVKQ